MLHQIWYQGEGAMPARYAASARRLREMNPDWRHVVWDADGLRDACSRAGPRVLARYDSFPHMHQRIDLGRYAVLLLYGGLSVDLDTVQLRPLSAGLPRWMLETDVPVFTRLIVSPHETYIITRGRHFGELRMVNNAMILCPKGAPGMRALIDAICASPSPTRGPPHDAIMRTTGPEHVSEIVDHLSSRGLVRVVPPVYFEPCIGLDPTCRPPPDAVMDHRHENSWIEMPRGVVAAYYTAKAMWPPVGGLAIVMVAALFVNGAFIAATHARAPPR